MHISKPEIFIRSAVPADVDSLKFLMSELGYPASREEIQARFENILQLKDFRTLLAITASGEVAGMIGMCENYGYEHNAKYVRVLAMVVSSNYRNLGIGKLLMAEADKWALEINAYMIVLTSGLREERKAAYVFYQRIGYQLKSSGFVKLLP